MKPYPNYFDLNNPNNMNMSNSYYRGNPFNVPRMGAKEFTSVKKPLTFNKALTNAEKGIDTISSIIPIYQKVKPVIENGKDFVNLIKTKIAKANQRKVEKVDVEVVDNENNKDNEKEKETSKDEKKEETKPNAPYF